MVCIFQSIRTILAIATDYDPECRQLNLNTAFLNADVEEEVYIKTAPGYEGFDENGFVMAIRLLKSPYGFRQSPSNLWGTSYDYLVEIGF